MSQEINQTNRILVPMVLTAIAFTSLADLAMGSHGVATVSDIDGDYGLGTGLLSGSYTHVPGTFGDHPWYTFNASAGQTIDIDLVTTFGDPNTLPRGSYLWLFEVLDGNAQVGDVPGADIILRAESTNTDSQPGPFLDQSISGYVIPTTNQYIIQIDSWSGASGNYELTLSRIPEPTTYALALVGLCLSSRRRR